jgi:hypothetical protein
MICHNVIEPFATREEAAEETAIRSEFPRLNVTHNGQRHPAQELARGTHQQPSLARRGPSVRGRAGAGRALIEAMPQGALFSVVTPMGS